MFNFFTADAYTVDAAGTYKKVQQFATEEIRFTEARASHEILTPGFDNTYMDREHIKRAKEAKEVTEEGT